MKNLVVFVLCIVICTTGLSQIATGLDEVSSFQEDLVAVKKENKWGFLNKKGDLIIDYRDDFVLTESKDSKASHPEFNDGRCLIKQLVNDQYFYGYIDELGQEVIPPKYLNASNFVNGYAIVVVLAKDSIGYNKVLKKALTSSKMEEYIINVSGKTIKYLENPLNYIAHKENSLTPPKLRSKFIAPNRVAVLKKSMQWDIYEF